MHAYCRKAHLWPLAWLALVAWLGSPPSGLAAQQDQGGRPEVLALLDSAYAALDEGELGRARDLAGQALTRVPEDPRALIAQGRVYLAWPRIGRFEALRLFRQAARQAPDDPEAYYWIGRVGVALLGDDGEAIARRGLKRALALDPLYRDAWELWRRLYRSPEDRAGMVAILRPHAGEIRVRARIAELWVENGACQLADTALAGLERELIDPRWPAWRAECAFIEGREEEGWAHYERAIALADQDTTGALWSQIASIARPEERAAYAALPAAARAEFYRAFWAPRDPNVRTDGNERVGEHFRRRAEARDRFRLLHPLSMYHYHAEYRDWISRTSSSERQRYVAAQVERGTQIAEALRSSPGLTAGERLLAAVHREDPGPELQRLLDLDAGFKKPDLTGISPDILPLGRNLPEMIDDRGLVFIRHGPPERIEFRTLDVEEWAYDSGARLRLRFDRGWYPPNPPLPDMIHRPMTASQARSVGIAMTSDRSSLPAPLEFGFWFARFRASEEPHRTELLIFPDATVAATAVLWDGAGRELGRDSGQLGDPIRLTSQPGRLLLAVDAERSDSLGRYRGVIELGDFGGDTLTLSDLLVAGAIEARGPTREEAAAAALPSLSVPFTEDILLYLEVYGLAAEQGVHRFEVTYEFEQARGWLARLLGGKKRVALRFERLVPAGGDGVTVEAVRVGAGEVAPGRYTLKVRVRDLVTGGEGRSRAVSIRLLR